MINQEYYHIRAGVMLDRAPPWSVEEMGFDHEDMGDCGVRSAKAAMAYSKLYPETSSMLLTSGWDLLRLNIRWPDEIHRENIPGKKKLRSQKSMTSDPWVMTATASYLITGGIPFEYMPNWLASRSYLRRYIKYLRTGESRYMKRFEASMRRILWWRERTDKIKDYVSDTKYLRWTRHIFGIHGYGVHLYGWMAYTTQSTELQNRIAKYYGDWNILLRLLCGKFVAEWEIETYVSVKGYRWSAEYWQDNLEPIPIHETYHLDKDLIRYLWNLTGQNS